MGCSEEISIKLELIRDKSTDKLKLITHFNPDSNNFHIKGKDISWMPTYEEICFLNEATQIMEDYKAKKQRTNIFEENIETKYENKQDHKNPPHENTYQKPVIDASEIHENIDNLNEKIKLSYSDRNIVEEALKKHLEGNKNLSDFDKQKILEKIINQNKKPY